MFEFGQRFKAKYDNWREDNKNANNCNHSSGGWAVGMLKKQPNFALKFIFGQRTLLFLYKAFVFSKIFQLEINGWKMKMWLLETEISADFNSFSDIFFCCCFFLILVSNCKKKKKLKNFDSMNKKLFIKIDAKISKKMRERDEKNVL